MKRSLEKTVKTNEIVAVIRLTGNTDTDKIITEKLSESDFVNLYRAIPNMSLFQKDFFWQERFQQRHGNVPIPQSKKWKEMSLHLGYFNWCPADWFAILGITESLKKQLLLAVKDFFNSKSRFWEQGLIFAIQKKDRDLINFFIWKGASCWNDAMAASAAAGDQELVLMFLNQGANNLMESAEVAKKNGYPELAKELLAISYTDYHI